MTSTSAAVPTSDIKRLVCPAHGPLAGTPALCDQCGKKPYDLNDPDDRNLLRSLRDVERSARTLRARIICFPLVFIVMFAILGGPVIPLLVTPLAGEPLARALERLLRRTQPAAFRGVDRELLG